MALANDNFRALQREVGHAQRKARIAKLRVQKPCHSNSLHLDINTLVKPYLRTLPKPLKNQPEWTDEQYLEALKRGAAINQSTKLHKARAHDRITVARDIHLGAVCLDETGEPVRVEFDKKRPDTTGNVKQKEAATKSYEREYGRHQDEELKRVI